MKQRSHFSILSGITLLAILLFSSPSVVAEPPPSTRICKVMVTGATYPCSIGKSGVRVDKKEGDGATPAGNFLIREIFYRSDKLSAEEITQLKKIQAKGFSVKALTQDDGWVDEVQSADYNKFVKISALKDKTTRHESLWRDDDVYDIIAVIGYNGDPIVKGKGSAIFMHVARPIGYAPTLGCIAFSKADLLKVLAVVTPKTRIEIPVRGEIVLN